MQLAPQRLGFNAASTGSAAAAGTRAGAARGSLASLYTQPPAGPLTLEEFEDFAFDRLERKLAELCIPIRS